VIVFVVASTFLADWCPMRSVTRSTAFSFPKRIQVDRLNAIDGTNALVGEPGFLVPALSQRAPKLD